MWLIKAEDTEKVETFVSNNKKETIKMTFKGTSHHNFTDFPYFVSSWLPKKFLTEQNSPKELLGPCDGKKVIK